MALFREAKKRMERGEMKQFEMVDRDGIVHGYRFTNQLPLNESHPDLLVNFLEYWESDGKKIKNFSWVTDIELTNENVEIVMRGGRARCPTRL